MDDPRRRLLKAGLALPAALSLPRLRAAPTPACGAATPAQTAGPFYTPATPAKADFRPDDPDGTPLVLQLALSDTQCRPQAGLIVDLWQADSAGRYDNDGYRLRGHQRSGADGALRFVTVRPGNYGWRTRHLHLRVFGSDGHHRLTTQLYFPDEEANARDGLFQPALLLQTTHPEDRLHAAYTIVLD